MRWATRDMQRRSVGRERRRPVDGGFTLLEVMVALAILASGLMVMLNIVTRNVRATNHARMVTTATFLARAKIVDVETHVLEEGFVDNDQEDKGDFADEGFPQFKWTTLIEAVELPTDAVQNAQDKAQDMTENSNPMMAMAGFMGGFMSTLIEPIRVGLEESIRRVTVKVTWDEIGSSDQSLEVMTFMADPAKLDAAVGAVGNMGGGGSGGKGGSGGGMGGRGGGGQ